MTQLALVAANPAPRPLPARLAHDIRNAVAIAALHLETLERLAGPGGAKAASAAHALIAKASSMCNEAVQQAANTDAAARRTGFEILRTIQQIIDVVGPLAPKGFSIGIRTHGAAMVQASPQEVFRILFNLAYNAIVVAAPHPAHAPHRVPR